MDGAHVRRCVPAGAAGAWLYRVTGELGTSSLFIITGKLGTCLYGYGSSGGEGVSV